MKHGIALIPKFSEIQKFIEYQDGLRKLFPNLKPILSSKINVPHITLFQGEFRNFDYKKLIDEIAKKIPQIFEVKISAFNIINNRWLFLVISDEERFLYRMHLDIFLTIQNFNILNDKGCDMPNYYTDKEKEYYKKYGYRFTNDLYSPHFTLGKIDNLSEQQKNEIKKYTNIFLEEKNIFEIEIDRIVYHELGDDGSCSKIIY